jgi:hypothetical protein
MFQPKPKVRGTGLITYRCAACGNHITTKPWFSDGRNATREPAALTPNTKSYHQEHLPNGR